MNGQNQDDARPQGKLRVIVATPLGHRGRGGIDRLTDLIFDAVSVRPDLCLRLQRLVTRGQGSLVAAQFIFTLALLRFCFAAFRKNVDLLHIHLSDKGSAYRKTALGVVARIVKVPYVVHLHGAIFAEFWSGAPRPLSKAIDRIFTDSDLIVVLGHHWEEIIRNRLPHVAHKIRVLPNATLASRLEQIPPPDSRVRISCLGQLGQRKGTQELIEALSSLAYRPDWVATIAGDGKVQESQAQVQSAGISDRVSIPGWLDAVAASDLLRRTDLLVLPSFSENLPMVILEAFAHGLPVVTTPVGAIPEVVEHERNGLLVPAGDVAALRDALRRLLDDTSLRQRLGETAKRDHTEKYDAAPYITRLASLWRSVATP
jgi:glycosyltransferase involved in cell wall biosynthesis